MRRSADAIGILCDWSDCLTGKEHRADHGVLRALHRDPCQHVSDSVRVKGVRDYGEGMKSGYFLRNGKKPIERFSMTHLLTSAPEK